MTTEIRECGSAVYTAGLGNCTPYWTTFEHLLEATPNTDTPDTTAEAIWAESAGACICINLDNETSDEIALADALADHLNGIVGVQFPREWFARVAR